jgi:hypothetical protein
LVRHGGLLWVIPHDVFQIGVSVVFQQLAIWANGAPAIWGTTILLHQLPGPLLTGWHLPGSEHHLMKIAASREWAPKTRGRHGINRVADYLKLRVSRSVAPPWSRKKGRTFAAHFNWVIITG